MLYGNVTLFGVAEDDIHPHALWTQVILCHTHLSDIATQHSRHTQVVLL